MRYPLTIVELWAMRIENENLAKYASLEQDTPEVSNVR